MLARWKRKRAAATPRSPAGEGPRPARRWSRVRWAAVVVAAALVLAWLVPLVVARTPLRNRLLSLACHDLRGTVTAQSASLGWFSPVVLGGIQMRDATGAPVLAVESLSGERPLWRLLWDRGDLGRWQAEQAHLQLVLSERGSNVEELLAGWLEAKSASIDPPRLTLELSEALVSIDDRASQRRWQLSELAVSLQSAGEGRLEASFSGNCPGPNHLARIEGELEFARPWQAAAGGGRLRLETRSLPLELAEPLVRRWEADVELAGWLTSNVEVHWEGADAARCRIEADVTAEQLDLSAALLGRDRLQLERLKLPCKATLTDGQVRIEQLSADCEAGRASLEGNVDLDLRNGFAKGLLDALLTETYQLQAELDLARLAAILPETMHVRPGTEITAGQVRASLSRESAEAEAKWQGRLETSNLVAVNQGRTLSWEQPVRLHFAGRDGAAGPVVDELVCQAVFLNLEAAGKLDEAALSATYDLGRLAAELEKFVELPLWELAGDGWTYLSWKRRSDGRLEVDGEVQVRHFRLAGAAGKSWSEENLVVLASGVAAANQRRVERLDSAQLTATSGSERIEVELREPIESFRGPWPLLARAEGEAAGWLERLKPWLGELAATVSGKCRAEAVATISSDTLRLDRSTWQFEPFDLRWGTLVFNEPKVELQIAGQVGRGLNVELARAALASSTLAVEAQQVKWNTSGPAPGMPTGSLTFTGDLARLAECLQIPGEGTRLAGRWQGHVQLVAPDGTKLQIEVDTQVDDLLVERTGARATGGVEPAASPVVWRQPQVRLKAAAAYFHDSARLELARFELRSPAVSCDAQGSLSDLSGERRLRLAGQVDYDPELLLALVRPYVGSSLQVAATRQARPFSLEGPLASLASGLPADAGGRARYRHFSGEGSFGWTGASLYGFLAGSGELRGRLSDGVLLLGPLDLAVNDGRLTAAPRVRLWPLPQEATLDKGLLVSQVRITPEMCEQALKYIAPVLAGVTTAQGRFSVAMEGARLPLDRPQTAEAAGELTVHSIEVGPGPLVQELAVLLERQGSARLKRESVVPFRLAGGRVYHRDLELVFPDVTIRLHGSVGLDQSLAVVAELPVPEKWIGNHPLATALRNQTIRVPIGGTLDHPRLDRRALEQASSQLLRTGAQNLLLENLNKQLDKLFGPPAGEK